MLNIIIDITQQHWNPGWCSVDSSLCVMLYFPLPMSLCSCSFSVTPVYFCLCFFPHSLLVRLFCFLVPSSCCVFLHLSSCYSGVYFAFCLYLVCFFARGLLLFCRLTFCLPVVWIILILELDLLCGFALAPHHLANCDSHWVMWSNGIRALELQAAAGLQLDSELTFLHVDAS